MTSRTIPAGLLAVCAALLAAAPAGAATFRVTTTVDTATCAPPGTCGLRGALALAEGAAGPDVVEVPAGAYVLSRALTVLDPDVTIRGAGARATFIDGNGPVTQQRAITITEPGPDRRLASPTPSAAAAAPTVTLAGLTVRNGGPSGTLFGGNVYVFNRTVTLDHVRLTGGRSSSGGGLANQQGTVLITHSLIDGNVSTSGGGDGGGVANIGGGGPLSGATLAIQHTTITGNRANLGGALSQWNSAANASTLTHVTVAGNAAGSRGGGFIGDDPDEPDGKLTVRASVIAGNTEQPLSGARVPSNCDVVPTDAGGNVSDRADCRFTRADDRQNVDPRLQALANLGGQSDVLALGAGSPALDLIASAACASTADQRDVARPQGAGCDAGAYEQAVAVAPPPQVPGGACQGRFDPAAPDADGDGLRDACDPPPPARDRDRDGIADLDDNCPDDANRGQEDRDDNGAGDACDRFLSPTLRPIAGERARIATVSGRVFVRLPRTAARALKASVESGFVPLKGTASIPTGSTIDARDGSFRLTTATERAARRTQAIIVSATIARLEQQKATRARRRPYTELVLRAEPGSGRRCLGRRGARTVVGTLRAQGRGRFRVRARAGITVVDGRTLITVQDRCDGTTVQVGRGRTRVFDRSRGRWFDVASGRRYIAHGPLVGPTKGAPTPR